MTSESKVNPNGTAVHAAPINLYLHTHWDREWYLPFETYRAQLVTIVRQILQKLNANELPNFLLDGQICAVEDILEIDPSLEKTIRDLMSADKLAAGPWYVLADQMLVSGESLVRNLKIGLDTTRKFGPPAMIGYCPDTFGHTEDMPRILKHFGIDCAFVWRGVPPIQGAPVFKWQSQDGSSVLAHLLEFGYYQTAFHDGKPSEEMLTHLKRFVQRGSKYPCIVPVGADHLGPPENFSKQIQAIRQQIDKAVSSTPDAPEPVIQVSTDPITKFSSWWAGATTNGADSFTTIAGELRDNGAAFEHERAYMLPGVLSTRLYLKRDNRIAEHRITRQSEPLYAISSLITKMPYPEAELLYAWKLLLKNQPHDSICGCSIDDVHREMLHRSQKFHHMLNALDAQCFEYLCSGNSARPRVAMGKTAVTDPEYEVDRIAVFNLSSEPISCPVLVTWTEKFGELSHQSVSKSPHAGVQSITKDREPLIFSGTGREPDVKAVDLNQAWLWAENIPPFGYKQIPFEREDSVRKQARSSFPVVQVESRRLTNGLLSVEFDREGKLSVIEHAKSGDIRYELNHYFRDTGDGGDTYNYDPLLEDEPVKSRTVEVKPWVRGPLVGSLQATYDIEIPASVTESGESSQQDLKYFSRSTHMNGHTITTEISLRRGLPIVFFDTRWVNKSTDHRLEVVLDTGERVATSVSENHFSTIARRHQQFDVKLPVPKATEAPLDRFPCQRFFIANGQLFLNKGLPEYGVDGPLVSMTVLRAVSRLSRPRLMTRGGGAGPSVATPEANCLGMNKVTYAWAPLPQPSHSEQVAEAYRLAELFEGTAFAVPIKAGALPVESESIFQLDNSAIRCMAMYRRGADTFIRLLNVSGDAQVARAVVSQSFSNAALTNLDEVQVSEVSIECDETNGNIINLEFSPNQLATLCLTARTGAQRDD